MRRASPGLLLLALLVGPAGCLETTFLPEDAAPSVDVAQDVPEIAPDVPVEEVTDVVVEDLPPVDVVTPDAATPVDVQDAEVEIAEDVADADVPVDTGPALLPLGQTCTDDAACDSKACVFVDQTVRVCASPCTGECPAGFRCGLAPYSGSAVNYCLPLPGDLCKPCAGDGDCQSGLCINIEASGESLCSLSCGDGTDGSCPAGFVCQSFLKGELCVPMLDTCTCKAELDGSAWNCALSSPLGTCTGTQICGAGGWGLCSAKLPTAELCDGVDNDCNGLTDETFTSLGTPCGTGICQGGVLECGPDKKKLACSTDSLKLKKDTCGDGFDNDCNGQTDEGCPPKDVDKDGTPDLSDCAPYLPEIFPGAKETCCLAAVGDPGTPVPVDAQTKACDANCDGMVTACATTDADGDGFSPPEDCDDNDAKVYPGAAEKCGDEVDQDCSGGDLKCDPTLDTDGDSYMVPADCDDSSNLIYPGAAEACNFIDDDCDGVVDDGNPGGGAKCGPELGACKPGTMVCSHVGLVAQVTCTDAVGGEPELCNGLDDDCDAQTDEEFVDLGQPCDTDDADSCQNGKYLCSADGLGVSCGVESVTDLVEMCKGPGEGNGKDEDCDGQIDEVCYGADVDGDGKTGADDCNELDAGFFAGAPEGCCDPAVAQSPQALALCDKNCDGQVSACAAGDLDLDGKTGEEDCNEADPNAFSGAPEKCGDGLDQDCDGGDLDCAAILEADQDGDGFAASVDCKPFDKNIHPHADELCNGKDDDCDGLTDEGNPEATPGLCGSSEGLCQPGQEACVHVSFKALLLCVPKVAPAAEACNGADDNCNGKTDEYFLKLGKKCDGPDSDLCENGTWTCAPDGKGEVCANESLKDIAELCDGIDNDCDGQTDEGQTYFGKQLGETCEGQGGCGEGTVVCSPELQVAVCSTDAYGTESQAQPEQCNGQDDDCDGFTDEGMLFAGQPLGAKCTGNGLCGKVPGVVECSQAGTGAICSTMLGGSNYQGSKETCNGVDDNCDGHVDEGMTVADSTCKQVGICDTSNVKASCKSGKWQCNYQNVVGYQGDSEVFCDGLDNDCDGKTDDEFQVGLPCDTTDTDQCPNGVVLCSSNKLFGVCGDETVVDIIEACNAKDDDCDGSTDEDYPLGQACDGGDVDQCKNGTWTCAGDATKAECVNESVVDIADTCNGLDDDCDGQIDEDFPDLGNACDGPDSDQCKHGEVICSADGSKSLCGAESQSDIVEECDGADNDCDGQTDEGQLYQGVGLDGPCKGVGACGNGKVVCSPITKKATCSTNPDAYLIFDGKELCDGLDNDCNGQTDDSLSWKGKLLGESCAGVGECGPGVVECGGDKAVTCSTLKNGSQAQAKAETCNGLDDDCDGSTDNGLTVQDSTCLKVGVCASDKLVASCQAGKWQCDYAAVPGYQADEKLCDGLDNDCDGQTDEGFDVGQACDSDDTDQCKTGTFTCASDGSKAECVNESLTSIPEVCDTVDNDCDGATDEGFQYDDLALGASCKGKGACGLGKVVCSVDTLVATCSTNGDGPQSQAQPEKCDSQDNDCNGKTDDGVLYEGLPVGAPCSGIGECGLGIVVCSTQQQPVCSSNPDGPSSQAKPEICDGKDNDCNAQTDEGLDPKKSSCNTVGVCAQALTAACQAGAWKCAYSGFGFEAKETLCDDKDNDCNGVTDDGYPNKGKACDGPDPDQCKTGEFVCAAGGKSLECGPESGGASPEVCDGKDNDCNGVTDEVFPELGQACDGSDTDECPNGSWTCSTDGKSVQCVNEFIKNIQEVCDFKDNDCDGKTDEDLGLGEPCDGPDGDKCKFGTFTCGEGGKLDCSNESKTNILEICNNKDDDCDGDVDEGFEQKGLKCDLPSDNDACETGSYQCTAQGTLACVGDYGCVIGTACKQSKTPLELDQCLCGTQACSMAQGNACSFDGKCTCNGGAPCGFGKTCQAGGCK